MGTSANTEAPISRVPNAPIGRGELRASRQLAKEDFRRYGNRRRRTFLLVSSLCLLPRSDQNAGKQNAADRNRGNRSEDGSQYVTHLSFPVIVFRTIWCPLMVAMWFARANAANAKSVRAVAKFATKFASI